MTQALRTRYSWTGYRVKSTDQLSNKRTSTSSPGSNLLVPTEIESNALAPCQFRCCPPGLDCPYRPADCSGRTHAWRLGIVGELAGCWHLLCVWPASMGAGPHVLVGAWHDRCAAQGIACGPAARPGFRYCPWALHFCIHGTGACVAFAEKALRYSGDSRRHLANLQCTINSSREAIFTCLQGFTLEILRYFLVPVLSHVKHVQINRREMWLTLLTLVGWPAIVNTIKYLLGGCLPSVRFTNDKLTT